VIPILSAAETQALDRATEARGVSIEALMERAGLGCARAAARAAGGAYGKRLVAVCGKGNNGGDAIVAARIAAGWGMSPAVVLLAAPDSLREPAKTNVRRLAAAGVPTIPFSEEAIGRELARADVVLDGLFGPRCGPRRRSRSGPPRSATSSTQGPHMPGGSRSWTSGSPRISW
jgi:NAD(P)H-hydrate epimerase